MLSSVWVWAGFTKSFPGDFIVSGKPLLNVVIYKEILKTDSKT